MPAVVPEPNGMTGSPVRTFRMPLGHRLLGAVAMALIAALTLGMYAIAIALLVAHAGGALALALCASVMAALAVYLARDVYAKWTLRADFGAQGVDLCLPSDRSLVHRPPPFKGTVAYTDITAIDARYEAYRTLGLTGIQCLYALHLKDGRRLILGDDRSIGTGYAQTSIRGLAVELARRAGIEFTELGMVEGKAGILLVAGARPPAWDAEPLPATSQAKLWRRAMTTGSIPFTLFVLFCLLRALIG